MMDRRKTETRKSGEPPAPCASRGRRALPISGFLVFGLLAGGCEGPSDSGRKVQTQVEAQKARIAKLEEDVITLQKKVDEQKGQIAVLEQIAPERMAKLVTPVKIELDRMTGGYEEPGRPGDAGVVAYVQPIDANGDVVKAAGSIVMEVFDLANPPEHSLVARAALDVDNTAKAWHGRLWTQHFTVKCPWPPPDRKPPEHRELTVRVQFTDYLTGKTLTAQTACKIKFPADVATTQKAASQ